MTAEKKNVCYDDLYSRRKSDKEIRMHQFGWDKEFNRLRGDYVSEDIAEVNKKGKIILDVGCSPNSYMIKYCKNADIVGIDIARKPIEILIKKEPAKNFLVSDTTHLPFKSNTFDMVFAGEVLEHIPEPALVLDEWLRVLKKKGLLIITTPNKNRLSIRQSKIFNIEDLLRNYMARYIENPIYADYQETIHCGEFSYTALKKMLQKRRLKILKAYGIGIYGIFLSGLGIILPQYLPRLSYKFHKFFLGLGKHHPNIAGQLYVLARKE